MKGRVARHASWLLNWYRGKLDGYTPNHASKGTTCEGEVVELMDQAYWKLTDKTQQTFDDRSRPGVLFYTEGVGRKRHRSCRRSACCQMHPDFCGTVGTRSMSRTRLAARGQWCRNHSHYAGCKSDACRSRFELICADDNSIKAAAEAEDDARANSTESSVSGEPFSRWTSVKFEWTTTSDKLTSGFKHGG